MSFRTSDSLTLSEIRGGLKLVIKDGLAAEAMTTLTGGTFLVAIALYLGASNFQVGLLAALPILTNISQLIAIWLVQQYNNRRGVAVICNFLARFPLLFIALLPWLFSKETSLQVLIFLLFFHYLFGSIAGASWNSWMKDLVPEKKLGTYFSRRSRMIQILSVTLSLLIAVLLDYVKTNHSAYEMPAYSIMFLAGGLIGIWGVYILSRTPEPKGKVIPDNLFVLFRRALANTNFRNLVVFNSFWSFALNLATPFFTVYMIKTIGLSFSYIIGLGILSQLSSIFSIKMWGGYSDKFSNKTIISIAGPIYVVCMIAWTFTAMPSSPWLTSLLLILINIFSGVATAGINLAITNIGIKLAPKEEAIVYISARNMVVAFFSAIAPLVGGLMADFFATHQLVWNIEWKGPSGVKQISLLDLQHWNFLFLIGALLATLSLRKLKHVIETGEIHKTVLVKRMKTTFKTSVTEKLNTPVFRFISSPVLIPTIATLNMLKYVEKRMMNMWK
ncbi:MAG TPA: MFS transporter [Flavitalea sp.]|nr:MFS transporter [Flavitalea sp.]